MQTLEQTLDVISLFAKELEGEAVITRKMLSRVPIDKLDWQPHPKSMTLRALAAHVAELPGWPQMGIDTDELDFEANPYESIRFETAEDLLTAHDANLKASLKALKGTTEELLLQPWTLRSGEQIHSVEPKHEVIRISISQTIHHRAQLGVYLRLLDVPVPASYGPSADDTNF